MADATMQCPHCGKKIQITAALSAQIEEHVRAEFEQENEKALKAKDKEWEEKIEEQKEALTKKLKKEAQSKYETQVQELQDELEKKDDEVEKQKKKAKEVAEESAKKLAEEKEAILKKAKKEAEEQSKTQLEALQQQVTEQQSKIEKQREEELNFIKSKRDLEEKVKNQEVEMARKLERERAKITEELEQKYSETTRTKELEKDHLIASLKKSNEDLTRKLEQGSQQAQGEVVEVDIEETLRRAFYMDVVEPIEKGVRGADVHQRVNSNSGKACGSILWECKRTKAWSDGWISKLKEDRLNSKADIAVIVSENLPKEIKGFGEFEGVWVTNFHNYIGLASVIRAGLISVSVAKDQQVGKDQKLEALHRYLTGAEFKNRVEAIVEPFVIMKEDLEREKKSGAKELGSS